MLKVSLLRRIANAAAVLFGSHGDVSEAARHADCSRQTVYDHANKVEQAVQDAHLTVPCRAFLLAHNQQLLQENACLRPQLAQRSEFIEFNEAGPQRLAGTTSAMGLSLNQIEEVFDVLLKDQPQQVACKPPPSRATIGRWVLAMCLLAGAVLRVLDKHTRPLAVQLSLGEIFFLGLPRAVAAQ